MNKYKINWEETTTTVYSVEIEAENEEEARDIWDEEFDCEIELEKKFHYCDDDITIIGIEKINTDEE